MSCFAYVAQYVPAAHRRASYSTSLGLQKATLPLGPALNVLIVHLPEARVGAFEFTKYTYAGHLTAVLNVLVLLVVLTSLREPARSRDVVETRALSAREVCQTLRRSGAYMSYFVSFQNNWTNQTMLWTLPIITSELYPSLGILGNSMLFAVGGLAGILTAAFFPRLVVGMSDRAVLASAQATMGPILVVWALLFGCRGTWVPPLWSLFVLFIIYNVAFLAQMPSNNAIYTNLLGGNSLGAFQSLLEVSKTGGRLVAGYAIGETYAWLGPCWLWTLTISIWALQFVPFAATWPRLEMSAAPARAGRQT